MKIFKQFQKKKETHTPDAPVRATQTEPKPAKQGSFSSIRGLIKHPQPSEKAHALQAKSQYVFVVDSEANKSAVKEEVARRFGVGVAAVNIVRTRGKAKRFGYLRGRKSGLKKAIVTLKKGEKLDIA